MATIPERVVAILKTSAAVALGAAPFMLPVAFGWRGARGIVSAQAQAGRGKPLFFQGIPGALCSRQVQGWVPSPDVHGIAPNATRILQP